MKSIPKPHYFVDDMHPMEFSIQIKMNNHPVNEKMMMAIISQMMCLIIQVTRSTNPLSKVEPPPWVNPRKSRPINMRKIITQSMALDFLILKVTQMFCLLKNLEVVARNDGSSTIWRTG